MQTFDLEMAKHVQGGGFWSFLKFDSGNHQWQESRWQRVGCRLWHRQK
jgi:hypothetical protein